MTRRNLSPSWTSPSTPGTPSMWDMTGALLTVPGEPGSRMMKASTINDMTNFGKQMLVVSLKDLQDMLWELT